jgi:hypothetical protein
MNIRICSSNLLCGSTYTLTVFKGFRVKVNVILRPTLCRPVCLRFKTSSWAHDHICITVSCGFVNVGRLLWPRDGSASRLQLLIVVASEFVLGSKPRGTHYHILLSQIRKFSNLEGQVPVFISPRNRVAQLYPRHCVLLSSSPMTSRDTVEVIEPAFKRG